MVCKIRNQKEIFSDHLLQLNNQVDHDIQTYITYEVFVNASHFSDKAICILCEQFEICVVILVQLQFNNR
ncbi:hypothetical protein KUTeg_021010 [Tegillarca granosa]|uniref:Uncharacterized protein n=1 Tax=Tegillarca granosa TaxID=220873 RepID=A0ABQ9EFI5_TEGGR|nr:hypothetical protein KUTeg_021010 [Tegillarca granosa]